VFHFQSQSSLPKCELQTTLQWFHSFLQYFWVNPNGKKRVSQTAGSSTLYVC
jgi:hypothetical protein